MRRITIVGGGFAGLTAAITAAEAGAQATLLEAHRELGGRARTAPAPYLTNQGPHAIYNGGPHWAWLKKRGLLKPLAPLPPAALAGIRYHHEGALRRTPLLGMLRLMRAGEAPADEDFASWARGKVGERAARAAAHFSAVALFHHDPGSLSAAFVQERFRRSAKVPPEAHYVRGGWGTLIGRMADRARELGVEIQTESRVDTLPDPADGPVIVATSLESAAKLLDDPTLTWTSGRTALLDLSLRKRRGDPFFISDLDSSGWIERFTTQDRTLAPAGESLIQAQIPVAPGENRQAGIARCEALLDLGFPDWRDRVLWRSESMAAGRTGAIDHPGTTWRDRPAIDRGNGVYVAGDMVAAPGVLSEVSFTSAQQAATRALSARD